MSEDLFLANLPIINAAVAHVCRRHRLTSAESDDFASDVRVHFIERNYEPLRRFEGRSSLRTYLVVVVNHLFLDYRNRLWGKWRPTAEASRIGPAGVQFERLVVRDGWAAEQAMEILRSNHGVGAKELEAIGRLKTAERTQREFVAEREAELVESAGPAADANVVRAEQGFIARRVTASLERALHALPPEDRLVLKMRIDGVPVADVARALHLNQKRLYRTIERLLTELRTRLESDGFGRADVSALFGSGVFDEVAEPRSDDRAEPRSDSGGSPAPAALGAGGRRG